MSTASTVINLEDLLLERNYRALRTAFEEMNEVDIAHFIQELGERDAVVAFRTLPKSVEMEVFAQLDSDAQKAIVQSITDKELANIIEELMVDDAVDMLEEMPAKLVRRVLRNSSSETRALINRFLRYDENSAGSIMTAEFADIKKNMTVEAAIKRIRRIGHTKENIYTCYVIGPKRHLEGVVTVKDLLLAQDTDTVESLMKPSVISVHTNESRQNTAALLAKYDLISLPVVDAENLLVGIVTVDDALDVLQEEDTEDFEKMAAMVPSEKPYLKTGVFTLARNRMPWLLVLMLSGMFTGTIIGHFNSVFIAYPILVNFIPMLTGTGGNAGNQSGTLIIRGMALDEIRPRDFLAVILKEARVAILVGVALAIVNMVRMFIMYPSQPLVAVVVSITLIAAIIMGKIIGGVLPIIGRAVHVDPALMAAPFITTIVDAVVLIFYFSMAQLILPGM